MNTTSHRILLVDDDEALRTALRRALERDGHQVVEACDGRDALLQLDRQPVDLVITDLIMPESEGVELTFSLQKRSPKLPVVAMSGGGSWAPELYLSIAKTAGAADVFVKPFPIGDLLTRVRSLLANSGSSQA